MKNLERDRRRKKGAMSSQEGGFRTFVTEQGTPMGGRHMQSGWWCGQNCVFCMPALRPSSESAILPAGQTARLLMHQHVSCCCSCSCKPDCQTFGAPTLCYLCVDHTAQALKGNQCWSEYDINLSKHILFKGFVRRACDILPCHLYSSATQMVKRR